MADRFSAKLAPLKTSDAQDRHHVAKLLHPAKLLPSACYSVHSTVRALIQYTLSVWGVVLQPSIVQTLAQEGHTVSHRLLSRPHDRQCYCRFSGRIFHADECDTKFAIHSKSNASLFPDSWLSVNIRQSLLNLPPLSLRRLSIVHRA